MTPNVIISPRARHDLRKLTLWLRGEAGVEIAVRFATVAIACFDQLAASPGIGSPVYTTNAALARLRKWRVPGFPNYLIFYRPVASGIEIVRVLHASQDWWALLDIN